MAGTFGKRRVEFTLTRPDATKVALVGSFNNWSIDKHPMHSNGDGTWKKIAMLPPGTHEYKFWVDGRWEEDPQNERCCPNCFGGFNSVVKVG